MTTNQTLNKDWVIALGITQEQINSAINDIKNGEGVTIVGYSLGLEKHFREVEFNRVLTDLNIFNYAL